MTPYQSQTWLDGAKKAFGWADESLKLLLIRNGATSLAALPLRFTQHLGVTLAEIPGSELGNSDWFPQHPRLMLDRPLLDRAFSTLSQQFGVDVIRFSNLPPTWQGQDNPLLAYPATPSPDHFYLGPIGPTTRDNLPKRRRVDILRGQRRLEELMGPVTLKRASTVADVDAIHAAFIAQRNVRFREMGVDNIFAQPDFMKLFRELGLASLEAEQPFFCFDALYGGDEILATAIGIRTSTHYSQYINSNTNGPAAKYSLVGLLMYLLIDDLAAAGVTSMDMGVGTFNYKEVWTQKTPVFDLVLPLSLKGKVVAPAFRAKRAAKHFVKQNEHLWEAAKKFRLFKQSLGL